MNTILGVNEMLPSGQEEAATSVCCKVSWNYDLRQGCECRAEVHFLTKKDIINILLLTIAAIKSREDLENSCPDDNEAVDDEQYAQEVAQVEAEIREGMTKVRSVWGLKEDDVVEMARQCKNENDFARVAKQIFDSNRDVTSLLDEQTRIIYDADPEDLAQQVKPYLDETAASHGTRDEFCAWPLIKSVDIFLRQDILKCGICLIDLPGVADAIDSRVKIAEDYYSKLDVTLIVAPCHRAASESSAQKLMSDYQEIHTTPGSLVLSCRKPMTLMSKLTSGRLERHEMIRQSSSHKMSFLTERPDPPIYYSASAILKRALRRQMRKWRSLRLMFED